MKETDFKEEGGVSLSNMHTGSNVKILRVDAGRGLQARLASMGLLPGANVRVVKNDRSGPVVLAVKGARLMLGRGVTEKVMVRLV